MCSVEYLTSSLKGKDFDKINTGFVLCRYLALCTILIKFFCNNKIWFSAYALAFPHILQQIWYVR